MFLPGLLGSPMRAARGMTAMTQLLPAEGHCRRFAFRQPSADCGFYLAIIRKRTTYTGAFFVVLR